MGRYDEDGLGFKFFLWLAGIIVVGGIVLLVAFLIFSRAVYAWGFLGGFLAFAVVVLIFGWIYDKRHERDYAEDEASI
jgi:hypothetical protein